MRALAFSRTSVRCAIKLSNASLCISLTSCCVVESSTVHSLHSFPVLWDRGCGCHCLLPTYCCLMHHRTQGFKQRLLVSHGLQLTGLRWEVLFQSFRYWVCKNGQRSVVTPLVPGVYIAFRSSLAEHRASKPCLSSFPVYWLSGAILSFLSSNVKVPHRFLCLDVPRQWHYFDRLLEHLGGGLIDFWRWVLMVFSPVPLSVCPLCLLIHECVSKLPCYSSEDFLPPCILYHDGLDHQIMVPN